MRLLTYSAILGLSAYALTMPAHAEDDIVVNGLHCNTACQSWLGVGGGAVARHEPLQLAAPSRPASLPVPKVQMAVREVGPVLRPAPASIALAMPARGAGERSVSRAPSKLPTASLVPGDRLVVAPPVTSDAFTPAPGHRNSTPLPHPSEQLTSAPALRREAAPAPLDTPSDGGDRIGSATPPRRPASESADQRLERGLTTLPRLSQIVAVHGTIMVETAEDRAFERQDMARLVKETTRPKEFKTGFADPLSDKSPVDGQMVGQAR